MKPGGWVSIVPRPPEAKAAAGVWIGISVTRESQHRHIFDEPVLLGRGVMGLSDSTIRGVAQMRFILEAPNRAAGGCVGEGIRR